MKKLKAILCETLDIPEEKKKFLPSGYQNIGDIIILNLKPEIRLYAKEIGELILEKFPRFKTVCEKTDIVRGELRIPNIKVVAGENKTVTMHRENGCLYKIDVSKVMFSQGNIKERARLPKTIKPGEVIIDMFAGIGYFSIPIAKFAKPRKIHAIDKNPDSIELLKENIRLNNVGNVIEPILGDCRNITLNERADRIIMGYLPRTYEFLEAAFDLLKSCGIIHYHDTFRTEELWKKPMEILKKMAENAGFELKTVTHKAIVKHYAPGVEHIVIDAEFSQK